MRFVTMEENVWVGKKLLKTRKGTTTEVVLQDRLGSVLFRYNANTDTKKAYAYYPYGQSRGVNTPDYEDGFGTYTRLNNNENHYADQRYYNAKNGRFHQPDPYQASGGPTDPASWNRYAYVQGDPANYVDPKGLDQAYADGGWEVPPGCYANGYESCLPGGSEAGKPPAEVNDPSAQQNAQGPPYTTTFSQVREFLKGIANNIVRRTSWTKECRSLLEKFSVS
ncbi:MAG: RHS repeat-associated core domain-containing protein [Bryobacterales bacterium]|nr:RHS repeat-associated core domain-containing protein [Bryobacterales bacterium]